MATNTPDVDPNAAAALIVANPDYVAPSAAAPSTDPAPAPVTVFEVGETIGDGHPFVESLKRDLGMVPGPPTASTGSIAFVAADQGSGVVVLSVAALEAEVAAVPVATAPTEPSPSEIELARIMAEAPTPPKPEGFVDFLISAEATAAAIDAMAAAEEGTMRMNQRMDLSGVISAYRALAQKIRAGRIGIVVPPAADTEA